MTMHQGSLGTYNYIAEKWISPDFPFSTRDTWHRMGILGVIGDYILSCTQGDILEIGVGESSVYLSQLSRKYKRKIYYCDCSPGKIDNPLTVEGYLNTELGIFCKEDSDRMFATRQITPIALGFIDGDHNYAQVKKDFDNLLPLVVDNGYIFLHDTYPPREDCTSENVCGTVYKLRQEIEQNHTIDCITFVNGTAMGMGLTMCRKKPKDLPYYHE